MNAFLRQLANTTGATRLHGLSLETIQLNLGPHCNLECHHCHIGASPRRTESLSPALFDSLLDRLPQTGCRTLELTGGAPELHPCFRQWLPRLAALPLKLHVRTNLVVHAEPELHDLAPLLRALKITLIGSLPCYLEENVDRQRGSGTFARAIAAIRRLNALGYGLDPQAPLELVYNPADALLPPDQHKLEHQYRQQLRSRYGIEFTRLATITNMPIGRFRADLRRQGTEQRYLELLQNTFNPDTLNHLMCRHQLSIGWDGRLYDCDFNLALGLPIATANPHLDALTAIPTSRTIVTGDHCLACTAGAGSSCLGALVA